MEMASLQQSKDRIISRVANCTNCAHCVDLYTPKSDDAAELKKIRDEQYLTVLGWV
jgi:polyferredoxin